MEVFAFIFLSQLLLFSVIAILLIFFIARHSLSPQILLNFVKYHAFAHFMKWQTSLISEQEANWEECVLPGGPCDPLRKTKGESYTSNNGKKKSVPKSRERTEKQMK